ncbi:MAG: hypothetical protein AB7F89_21055 [Pirellulaceae bacterium]
MAKIDDPLARVDGQRDPITKQSFELRSADIATDVTIAQWGMFSVSAAIATVADSRAAGAQAECEDADPDK